MPYYHNKINKALISAKNNVISVDLRILLMATSENGFYSQHFVLYTAKMNWVAQKTIHLIYHLHNPPFAEELQALSRLTKLNLKFAQHDNLLDVLYIIEQEKPNWKKAIDSAQHQFPLPTNHIENQWEKILLQDQCEQLKHLLELDATSHNKMSTPDDIIDGKLSEILLIDVIKLKLYLHPDYQPNNDDIYWNELQSQHQKNDALWKQQHESHNVSSEAVHQEGALPFYNPDALNELWHNTAS